MILNEDIAPTIQNDYHNYSLGYDELDIYSKEKGGDADRFESPMGSHKVNMGENDY